MTKATSEPCRWCKGTKVDPEGESLGNPYPCIDCEGTGFKWKKLGRKLYYEELKQEEDELERKGLWK